MGSKYKWNENIVCDFFVKSLMDGLDISKKDNIEEIKKYLTVFYEHILNNENDANYLDFNIKKSDGGFYSVIANNIITALWFKNIIPNNTQRVLSENKLVYNDFKYTFNKKTKELKIQKLK